MPTLAVIGAGPGMGLAIARTFGSRGFDVALISRNRAKLDDLAAKLAAEGITAAAFPADVLDHDTLTRALEDAAAHFDRIDVLEYSPAIHTPGPGYTWTSPSKSTMADLQQQIEFNLYGAVTATQAVLPAMRQAGAETLLFTTGGGSITPNPMIGNINAAHAALRNWAINLHNELAGSGIQVGHVAISTWIGDGGPEGIPSATPEQIAPCTGICTPTATASSACSRADHPPRPRRRTRRPHPRQGPAHRAALRDGNEAGANEVAEQLHRMESLLGGDLGAPSVSPVAAPARLTDFTGLPPAYIEVGTLDIFRDESIDYAKNLLQAGVECELHIHPGAPHGHDWLALNSALSRRVITDRVRVITAL